MADRTVLVVEDDDDLRLNVADALALEGYETLLAANGREALDLLLGLGEGVQPCCVLLDLMMPVMDGRTFLAVLRRDFPERFANLPILVWSASGNAARELADQPLAGILTKPLDLEDLFAAIERQCGPA